MATINAVGNGLSGVTGSGNFAGSTSPSLTTPILGAATATSIQLGSGSVMQTYAAGQPWTPTFTCATPGNLSVAYNTQTGTYTKVGQLVFITFRLIFTPTFTTASGAILIGSLPFTPNVSNVAIDIGLIGAGYAWGTLLTQAFLQTTSGNSTLGLVAQGSANATASVNMSGIATGVQIVLCGSGAFPTSTA